MTRCVIECPPADNQNSKQKQKHSESINTIASRKHCRMGIKTNAHESQKKHALQSYKKKQPEVFAALRKQQQLQQQRAPAKDRAVTAQQQQWQIHAALR